MAQAPMRTLRPTSEEELAYLAGLIDGEGCISINRLRRNGEWKVVGAYVKIGMTDRLGVQLAQDVFGGGMTCKKRTGNMACYKPMWTWTVCGLRAAYVIDCILPYLRVKLPQARLLLQYQKLIPLKGRNRWNSVSQQELSQRWWMFDRMKRLNKRAKETPFLS